MMAVKSDASDSDDDTDKSCNADHNTLPEQIDDIISDELMLCQQPLLSMMHERVWLHSFFWSQSVLGFSQKSNHVQTDLWCWAHN